MKKITLALLASSMLFFACNKETEIQTEANYVETNYYPGNSENVKQEILYFLNKTFTYNQAIAKTSAIQLNIDPSEGKWLMEGASNYLSNTKLHLKTDTIVKFEMEIANVVTEDGVILMDGADMINEFDNFHTEVSNLESIIGDSAKIMDYEIIDVTNTTTSISIDTYLGLPNGDHPTASNYPNGLHPTEAFELYVPDLIDELGSAASGFYTNISFSHLLPFMHLSNPSDPNYYPQQDPDSPLFDPTLDRCGKDQDGNRDCRICYDCLFSEIETTYSDLNLHTKTWPGDKSDYYYEGTKTVIQNHLNSYSYSVGLIDVQIDYNFFVCACVEDNAWQELSFIIGRQASY